MTDRDSGEAPGAGDGTFGRIVEAGTTKSFKMTLNACVLFLAARPVRVVGSGGLVAVVWYGHVVMTLLAHLTH